MILHHMIRTGPLDFIFFINHLFYFQKFKYQYYSHNKNNPKN